MPLGYVLETPSGRLKAPFVERTEQLEVPLAHVVPEVSANVVVPLTIIAIEFAIDWRMALVSLASIPVGLGCYAIEMRDYAEKYGRVVAARATWAPPSSSTSTASKSSRRSARARRLTGSSPMRSRRTPAS